MYGIDKYLEACQFRKQFLQDQLKWLRAEHANYQSEAERLSGVSERIRQELVGYLLPEVNDTHIAALERRLSYPGLTPIKREYDAKFEEAERRRTELESMDEVAQHDFRLDQAQRDVDDVQPAYEKMTKEIGHWESSKWFNKLKRRGYFEPDYRPGFFRRFFDWRDVSFLMSELAKKAGHNFEAPQKLCGYYRNLRDEADTVIAAYDKRVAIRDRIVDLKNEHTDLLNAPTRLLGELFRELGTATVSHLEACPNDLRLELARDDQNLNAFLRKQIGTEKQIQYLRELSVTRIDSRLQQVDQELTKIQQKIRKLEMQRRRGKRKSFSRDDIERMRNVKAEKWERRRAKTIKIRGKISDFDKHDRGSCASDYLWWDLMTGGARADDVYEVREFRTRHPDWDYRTYDDPTNLGADSDSSAIDDAASDLASSMVGNQDDDLFSDPS